MCTNPHGPNRKFKRKNVSIMVVLNKLGLAKKQASNDGWKPRRGEASKNFYKDIARRQGENMRRIRKQKGLSLEVVADILLVSHQAVLNYETGKNRISLPNAQIFCEVLKVDINELLK